MQTIFITIERERDSRSSREGARFRVKVAVQPGAPKLLMSTRLMQSVIGAKREAEALFRELVWTDEIATPENPDVRASAFLEIE